MIDERCKLKTTSKKTNNWNVGFSILKIWLCFAIVISHFHNSNEAISSAIVKFIISIVQRTANMGVPVFVFISFLVCDMESIALIPEKIEHRLERLLIPHLFFSITTWLLYLALNYLVDTKIHNDFSDLVWQILFGSNINSPLWFWVSLLIITVIIILTMRISNNRVIKYTIIAIEGIFSIIMQYTGLNTWLFGELDYKSRWTLGRVCELMPYAVAGIFFFHALKWMKKNSYFSFSIVIIVYYMFKHIISLPSCDGFYYQGLGLMCTSICLVLIFYLLPFELLPYPVTEIINNFSKYSMGIMAIHYPVYTVLCILFFNGNFEIRLSFGQGCIHYLICLILVYWGSHIPNAFIKKAFI